MLGSQSPKSSPKSSTMNANTNATSFVTVSTCESVHNFRLLVALTVGLLASAARGQEASVPDAVPVNTVIATVKVGGSPLGVVVSPDSTLAYVANHFDNTVSVISG